MNEQYHAPLVFAGFDIETTSADIESGHVIQVGLAPLYGPTFHSDVRPLGWDDLAVVTYQASIGDKFFTLEAEATKVNSFTIERIMAAPSAEQVDLLLSSLLRTLNPQGRVTPVGFNVGSFDMQFIRREMPRSYARFGYRSVDLNALLFSLTESSGRDFYALKEHTKKEAERALMASGVEARPHDALYDAQVARHAWQHLRVMHLGVTP